MNSEARLRHSPYATYQTIAGEAILIHMHTGTYYSLNEIGTAFWEMLDGAASIGECANRIAQEYDAPVEVIESDLLGVAGDLVREELAEEAR